MKCPEGMSVGWKAVRGGIVKLAYFPCEIVRDPEFHDAIPAYYAPRVLVLKGGGRSIADTSVLYRKGRWVYANKNPKAQWTWAPGGIYFFLNDVHPQTHMAYSSRWRSRT